MTTDRELMQQALDSLEQWNTPLYKRGNVITALRARLAQPEPEELGEIVPADEEQLKRIAKLVEPEPVAWMHDSHVGFNVPLYTAPPQREWKGLTDEEIENCFEMSMFGTCRAIEAKLKEKNG